MNGFYSDEEGGGVSPQPSQGNSSSKNKKKKRNKRSTIVKKKNSAATADTKNFLKDIDNILDDKDEAVIQNPKSSRMTISINKNVQQGGLLNRTNESDTRQGYKRHSVMKTNANPLPPVENEDEPAQQPSKINKILPSAIQEQSLSDDEETIGDDSGPSPLALAMREKFRKERLSKVEIEKNSPASLPEKRAVARERLKTTVQNVKNRPNTTGGVSVENINAGSKRFSVAQVPQKDYTPKKQLSTANDNVTNKRLSVSQKQSHAKIRDNVKADTDTRLNASDLSSSSDNDSDYYDSSSSESDEYSYESSSEDFDINDVGVDSGSDESSESVVDPKFEESKADPLIYDMLMLGDGGVGKTAILHKFIKDSFTKKYSTTRGINQLSSILYMGRKKMLDRGKLRKSHVHVKLNIWDIGGRLKKHAYIKNSYILNSIIVIVVYDITSLDSYLSALETVKHVRTIKYDQMVVLVGNKADNSTVAADDDDYDSDEDEDNIVVSAPPPPTGLRRLSMIGSRRGSVSNRQQVAPVPQGIDGDNSNSDSDGGSMLVLREIAKREAALEALKIGALFFETSAKSGHNIYVLFNEISKILVHKRRKLLFKIEAGIKKMQEENDENSSDYETDSSSESERSGNENEEGKSQDGEENGKKKSKFFEESSSDDDSVLSAMSDWSDVSDDSDDDYVDMYGWGGKKKSEKAECTIM